MHPSSGVRRAVDRLEPGAVITATESLTGGVSATVTAVDIQGGSGAGARRVVVREHTSGSAADCRTRTAKEYHVLRVLRDEGFPVPEPFLADHSDTVDPPFIVMEWIEGSDHVSPSEVPSAVEQMAAFMVRLHALDPGKLAIAGLELRPDPSRYREYLPDGPVGDEVRTALDSRASTWTPNDSALLHGDFWPGNLLWIGGTLEAVLDWEDARRGDPLSDLAVARLEIECRYDREAMERFTARYLELRDDDLLLRPLPLWDACIAAWTLSAMDRWGLPLDELEHYRAITTAVLERAARELREA